MMPKYDNQIVKAMNPVMKTSALELAFRTIGENYHRLEPSMSQEERDEYRWLDEYLKRLKAKHERKILEKIKGKK